MAVRVGIGLGAVLVLLGMGSCVSGVVLERAYERIIDEASAASEGSWEIAGEYQRGWLSSSAQTRLSIVDERGGEPLVLPLEHDVVHGLLPLGMLARGGSPFDLVVGRVVTEHHLDSERLPRFNRSPERAALPPGDGPDRCDGRGGSGAALAELRAR